MFVLPVPVFLLLLFSVLKVSGSSITHRTPYSTVQKTTVGASPWSRSVHNVTGECGGYTNRRKIISQCQRYLYQMTRYGYPWSPTGRQRNYRNERNVTERINRVTLRDALDALEHVCYIYDSSHTCLAENGIRDYCIATTEYSSYLTDFQFICHHSPRNENLVRSLQCLHDTRLMATLYFHIANRCRGMGILDDIMRRYKNAYFYAMGIKPGREQPIVPGLYCLPRSVISTCIRDIVKDHCGIMTADFVQNYMLHLQDWFDQTLKSAGLISNICDRDISSDILSSTAPIPPRHAKLSISRLLEITASGTALDTVWGTELQTHLHRLSGEEICSIDNAIVAYFACVLSSDDKIEKSKFNILQFGHETMQIIYHGSHCNRLNEFTACWNLLQETCGHKVQGLEHHATLLVEGCKIESEMDTVGCHWQDMLLPHYLQASRVTVWPMENQCLIDPIHLEGAHHNGLDSLMDNLDTVISLLQPGVEEISKKCGLQPAKRLSLLFDKLRYLQRGALKYADLYFSSIHNYGN